MKKIVKLLMMVTFVLAAVSCASSAKNDEPTPAPEKKILGVPESKYYESVKKSLLTAGNNYLLKNVLEKLAAGEENVYIAALGGSVTEGAGPSNYKDGYAYQFANLIKSNYAADAGKVIFDGAGLGGTPSPLGLIRYKKHVLDVLGTRPDLLIIEFAVNDYQECTNTRAFEYLIRDAVTNGTAVIVVYAAATYGNQQSAMSPVATLYRVPQVSISDGLRDSGINQMRDVGIYYADYVHPTKNGHKFMCDCLDNLLQTVSAADKNNPYEVPDANYNGRAFDEFVTVDRNNLEADVKILEGGFTKSDKEVQGFMKGGLSFPENWHYDGSEAGAFKITANCKSMILVYKNAGNWGSGASFGTADVYVDGKKTKTYKGQNGGWNNCEVVMVLDESEAAEHTVEVRMAEGDEAKRFTICAIGYAK